MKKKSFNPKQWPNWITVVGAQEHNLKSIDVSIPKECLTVITGPSGSGKSSLALDILYTEGKRRYMESLSSYARQFLGVVKKPNFERIDGLCPAIAIEQKTVGSNPRSTVGTITEIYDYFRILYARIGTVHCPQCGLPIQAESPESVAAMLQRTQTGNTLLVAAPIAHEKKGEFTADLLHYFGLGYYRFIIDGKSYKFSSPEEVQTVRLAKTFKHTIDVLIDSVDVTPEQASRLVEAVEKAFSFTGGLCKIIIGEKEYRYSAQFVCVNCAISVPEIEPRIFSFNSPLGACPACEGLGVVQAWPWEASARGAWNNQGADDAESDNPYGGFKVACSTCNGKRLNKQALSVTVGGKDIYDLSNLAIKKIDQFFAALKLGEKEQEIALSLLKEIRARLSFLIDVGVGYLTLNRISRTLSGGEGQRIRLATQIGSALSGVLYILDEPSIGLHQRDNDKLINTLKSLRDQGNTVVVVEHDLDTMRAADYLIDMGPAAGTLGGQITAVGTPEQIAENKKSLTGSYLSGRAHIAIPSKLRKADGYLYLEDAQRHNLKHISVKIPLKVIVGISGVSGSGKSTLVMQELVPAVAAMLAGKKAPRVKNHTARLTGGESLESMVVIDQSPIGRTPRSNPATYLGIFDEVRRLFAELPESNARGYTVGRFSFNVPAGRCAECSGDGSITVEMHFLPEVVMQCRTCKGKRYNAETLQIRYKGKNIAEILQMTALEALAFFQHHRRLAKALQLLCDVGLDYLQLGQPSTTLSGGEAQRIKLVNELAKRGSNTLYILDEPTTGLHTHDIAKLLIVLNTLVDKGNSMIIIEHNLDVLKTVDYIIDMGPEGGDEGGYVVAEGVPTMIAKSPKSHTGRYLAAVMRAS